MSTLFWNFFVGSFSLLRCDFRVVAVILAVIMPIGMSERFLSSTAHQFLRFEERRLTNLVKYGILTAEEKTRHGVNRLVT